MKLPRLLLAAPLVAALLAGCGTGTVAVADGPGACVPPTRGGDGEPGTSSGVGAHGGDGGRGGDGGPGCAAPCTSGTEERFGRVVSRAVQPGRVDDPRAAGPARVSEQRSALALKVAELAGFDGGPYKRPTRDIGWASTSMYSGEPLTFWWRGPVPKKVQLLFEEARRHFAVTVRQADYSWVELEEASHRIFSNSAGDASAQLEKANIMIQSVGQPDGGRGLDIRYWPRNEQAPEPCGAAVRALLEEIAGVPVTVARTRVESA